MPSTRTAHHLHGVPLKPSIKVLDSDKAYSNLFTLSFSGNEITFFISDDEDFHTFLNKMITVCQEHLTQKAMAL